MVENAFEKKLKEYKNMNIEIDVRTNNNRLIFLLKDQYHGDVIAAHLENNKQAINDGFLGKDCNFVKDLLNQVSYSRMLIVGNYQQSNALDLAKGIAQTVGLKKENQS